MASSYQYKWVQLHRFRENANDHLEGGWRVSAIYSDQVYLELEVKGNSDQADNPDKTIPTEIKSVPTANPEDNSPTIYSSVK